MAEEYDLVILGGGTGGYVAAIRAAQLGLKVAVVEKEKLGGTCLHKGCIPSKAFLRSAEVYHTAKTSEDFGVNTEGVSLDFNKVQSRKDNIVNQLYKGVQYLLNKGDIHVYKGHGRILGPSIFSPSPGTISVEMDSGEENEMLIPKNVIIATGSRPNTLPGMDPDGKQILTSDEALELENLPSSIIIIGGGVIGIEWASMLSDFGVEVTVLEYSRRILPGEDEEVSKEIASQLKKRGVKIVTNAKVLPEKTKRETDVTIYALEGEKEQAYQAKSVLLSVGRKANTEDIGLQNTDIVVEKGFVQTNKWQQTKESHIYAIGDVIGGMQLAHVASHEGIIAVEHMTENHPHPLDFSLVARCTYSRPEVASIGLTEEQAREEGYDTKIGTFPFKAIGKALVNGDASGFVKFIADKETDDLLGVHMVGSHVTDLISEAAVAKLLDAASFEVAEAIHPHPTLSEIIGEAALAVDGKAIHS
ncbi:dihydrolipoyl dehydrogenase [Thalassorhabdus alkalitolerans]|uniref:Dihydrolipoyl dehydrogenase n=1 Tax=Thalassorhabdus alkalitolerans TaxID=2282697 RepID=A0ABW0YSE7_9BACI